MNYNSVANQNIKQKFVNREVMAVQTTIVEALLKQGWNDSQNYPSYEDMEDMYYYEDADGNEYNYDELEEKKEEVQSQIDDLNNEIEELEDTNEELEELQEMDLSDVTALEEKRSELSDLEAKLEDLEGLVSQHKEVYEWWLVTGWLSRKLKDQGEVILEFGNSIWWGRCCTGQAILLDAVISRICEDMEILEGQSFDWSK